MSRPACRLQSGLSFTLVALCTSGSSSAQSLGADFVNDYALGSPLVPPVATEYGGMTFKAGDPSKLLIVGESETPLAAIYEVDVTRDAQGHVIGLAGTASVHANAPNADAGLRYGPGGVLFYTTYPSNMLGQIKPGSTSPDRLIDLTALGVFSSVGGLEITPSGFPGAGSLKLTSYNGDAWYSADLVADGTGTYDVVNLTLGAQFGPVGPESAFYVDASYPAINVPSVVVCQWYVETVAVYEVDANGDPIVSTQRDFLSCCGYWPLGSTLDPVTGDFVFADYGSGGEIVIAKTLGPGPVGTAYCGPGVANSTGSPATISAFGFPDVATNDVTLTASQLPANAFGFFLTSQMQSFVTNPGGSQGNLCLGGAIGRYVGPGQIQNSGAGGSFGLALDLTLTPTPTGLVPVVSGETWNFQCWHRDAVGGTATSNFTDAVSIDFQ